MNDERMREVTVKALRTMASEIETGAAVASVHIRTSVDGASSVAVELERRACRVHDMAGKPFCSKCGYVPELTNAAPSVILCSESMPEAEQQVLFFVPNLGKRGRWKTGHWDNTARAPRWWDDETSVGDEPKLYTAEEVTHWLPMPGEP